MSFKNLFIKSEETEEPKVQASFPVEEKKADFQFPSEPVAQPVFSKPVVSSDLSDEIYKGYEKGFENLNKPGVDFFEVYKVVDGEDIENPTAYKIALKMCQMNDSTFTKEKALDGAKFYIDNIEAAYKEYNAKGVSKRESLLVDKGNESSALKSEIETLAIQIEQLKRQKEIKESSLSGIDSKYESELRTVEEKLSAHTQAKSRLIDKIKLVANNITKI